MNSRPAPPAPVILIIIMLGVFSCTDTESAESCRDIQLTVTTAHVTEKEVRSEIKGFGNLTYRRKADITTAVDGVIKYIHVHEGEYVETGQLLAETDNIQLEIRKKKAEAALFSAEEEYSLASVRCREGKMAVESRMLELAKSEINLIRKEEELTYQKSRLDNKKELMSIGGITEEEIRGIELTLRGLETEASLLQKDIQILSLGFRDRDIRAAGLALPDSPEERNRMLIDINTASLKSELSAAGARVRSAATELESAEQLLSETRIVSPICGIIGAGYAEEGERIKADARLFTVFDSSEMDLLFTVPENVGVMLRIGEEVSFSPDALSGTKFTAVIRQISPTVDSSSGSIAVRASIDNANRLFRPGMFSRFSLSYGEVHRAVLIPADALIRRDADRGEVYRLRESRIYPAEVTIISEREGNLEIEQAAAGGSAAGLTPGDIIITAPSPLLQEGDKVNAR